MRSFLWNNVFCVIRVTDNSYHRILEEIKVLNTFLPGLRFLISWALWAATAAHSFETLVFSIFSSASSSLNFFNFSMESLTLTNTLFGKLSQKILKCECWENFPHHPLLGLELVKQWFYKVLLIGLVCAKEKYQEL